MRRFLLWFHLAAAPVSAVDFSKEVFPVLQRSCFECHGAEVQKGKLRLDMASPRHAEVGAELLRRVQLPADDKEAMPKRGDRLKPVQITALKAWIESGAQWPEKIENLTHWSYVPPVRPKVPAGTPNPVDAFIREKLTANGLQPAPRASPETLIRRLSLDLTGLPPTPEEVAAFKSQPYETAVDRLLSSKQFGVRWARPWLDLARYADSHGFQRDDLRDIWAYRDWVVDALNANMPFDQFTLEQIAGDLLPGATPSQIIATGFHRCTPTNVEAGTEPEESRINQVIDRVNTTGAVWLGTTLECAQCHNHKYDPFTQKDFYSLLAYYNNTEKEAERSNPKVPGSIQFNGTAFSLPDTDHDQQRKQLGRQIKELDARISTLTKTPEAKPTAATALALLKPDSFVTESDAETELQPDGSTLLTGPVPDKDTYTVEAPLPSGNLTGILIETLLHDSIAGGGGPGRRGGARPNFVINRITASLVNADGSTEPLVFARGHTSHTQKGFDIQQALGTESDPRRGWAINPRFHEAHWAALELAKPLKLATGSKLRLKLEQNFGQGLVIGRLRLSAFQTEVATSLPEAPAGGNVAEKPPEVLQLEKKRAALQKQLVALKPMSTEVMRELPQPRMTAIFKRGVYTDPTTPVTPATPAIFKSGAKGPPNRLTLGRWLASRDNPLAARVTVNRWWADLFGQGIVTTLEDFGIKGAPPSHPELLDWLAVEFMESGWNMKHVLKLIVMSETYRQSSELSLASAQADPSNQLLSRFPRFRLDAETIRDNALSIAGLLDMKQGGAPIRPPQPEGLWKKVGGQQYDYQVSEGGEKYRRGLYVVLKRGSPYPSFVNFDASARMACVVRRSRSNTPLQALTLLNDPVYVEAAKHFALRIVTGARSSDLDEQIAHAFQIALARPPSEKEAEVLKTLWEAQFAAAEADAKAAGELATGITLPKDLTPAEFSAHYALATALLNLDECITKP